MTSMSWAKLCAVLRDLDIVRAKRVGMRAADIGEVMGLTRQQVNRICKDWEWVSDEGLDALGVVISDLVPAIAARQYILRVRRRVIERRDRPHNNAFAATIDAAIDTECARLARDTMRPERRN